MLSNNNSKEENVNAILAKLAFANLKEQRSVRRWRIFFRLFLLGSVIFSIWLVRTSHESEKVVHDSHTAMISINGEISADHVANADYIVESLQDAFRNSSAKAVLLKINSPGGSPVHSGIVYDEIRRLKAKNNKPVYAVIGDVGASGAYYVAAGADKIFVNKASIVGSIGVIMDNFGFTEAMQKIGIERRMLTAGSSKGFLDPYSPLKEDDVAHVKNMLGQIHQQFISAVREGRGERLKDTEQNLFSGLVWSGQEAIKLGLADDYGTVASVARDLVKEEKVIDYTKKRPFADELANRFGMSLATSLMSTKNVQQIMQDATEMRLK